LAAVGRSTMLLCASAQSTTRLTWTVARVILGLPRI